MRLEDTAGVTPRASESRADGAQGPRDRRPLEPKRASQPSGVMALALERAKQKK
jgi:hypothetical protein